MRSIELPGTTFAVRFPENNCTPQNVRHQIRFKHSSIGPVVDGFNRRHI